MAAASQARSIALSALAVLLLAAAADAARPGPLAGAAPRRALLGGKAWVDQSTAQTLSMDDAQRGISAATLYGGVGNTMMATQNGQASAVMTTNAGRGYGGWYNGWGNSWGNSWGYGGWGR